MCGRQLAMTSWEMEADLKCKVVKSEGFIETKGENLPTDLSPVITHADPRVIQYMRWGLIPPDMADPARMQPMINIRSETVANSGKWQNLLMMNRCLSICPAYYEWHNEGDEKVQVKVAHPTEKYVYMAAVWTTWLDRNNANSPLRSFAIVTSDPDNNYRAIHDRMPVILNREQRRLWMHPQANLQQLLSVLQPHDSSFLKFEEVGRKPLKGKGRR